MRLGATAVGSVRGALGAGRSRDAGRRARRRPAARRRFSTSARATAIVRRLSARPHAARRCRRAAGVLVLRHRRPRRRAGAAARRRSAARLPRADARRSRSHRRRARRSSASSGRARCGRGFRCRDSSRSPRCGWQRRRRRAVGERLRRRRTRASTASRSIARHPPPADWERQKVRNDDSLVLELRWRDVSMLLTGDIGKAVERQLGAALRRRGCASSRSPHHGSLTSSSGEFVERCAPQIAVVSAGRSNHFGHPVPEVLERYRSAGAEMFRTDADGAVTVDTDGYVGRRATRSQGADIALTARQRPRRHEGHEETRSHDSRKLTSTLAAGTRRSRTRARSGCCIDGPSGARTRPERSGLSARGRASSSSCRIAVRTREEIPVRISWQTALVCTALRSGRRRTTCCGESNPLNSLHASSSRADASATCA